MRRLTDEAIKYLIEREGGMRLDVHDDGYGFPTVGVGHLVLDADELQLGDRISKDRGKRFLHHDMAWACRAVEENVTVPLQDWEFDALAIFCFNVGVNAFAGSTLVRKLNAGEDKCGVVQEQLPRWRMAAGKRSRGLYNRRIDTAQMFCVGDYTVNWSGLEGQV